jgi:Phosphotransferase enzyme family
MLPAWVLERVAPDSWEPVGGGYTRAPKLRVRLQSGESRFVKFAENDELAARSIVAETRVYGSVTAPFLPTLYDMFVADGRALIVLEDLTDATWPPPYPDDVAPLFEALEAVASIAAPPDLPRLAEREETPWQRIAREPELVLGLGVCSESWLQRALPALLDAEARVPLSGDRLVHHDVWAENLCFTARGAVLVDWAEARIGNPAIDVAFALLSLQVEVAVTPQIEDEPALAAFVTGVIAAEAAAPLPTWTASDSTLRADQLDDLRVALRWVAAQLALPPPHAEL